VETNVSLHSSWLPRKRTGRPLHENPVPRAALVPSSQERPHYNGLLHLMRQSGMPTEVGSRCCAYIQRTCGPARWYLLVPLDMSGPRCCVTRGRAQARRNRLWPGKVVTVMKVAAAASCFGLADCCWVRGRKPTELYGAHWRDTPQNGFPLSVFLI
jgi:hypothetical protein